jgi:hypothetical protein
MKSNEKKNAFREICKSIPSRISAQNYVYLEYRINTTSGSFNNELCSVAFMKAWGITKSNLKRVRKVY